mmetsp:Transcript_36282/g.58233  ORF Transcript_36282/g.58233 Transcript_36282/m.58233 type:complete len:172 (-) Transcript_36282:100-615(-)
MRRHPKTNEKYSFDGGDFNYRQKVEDRYQEVAEAKKTVRMYAAISAAIGFTLLLLNLITYKFRIGQIFNEITLGAIGHVINVWLVLTSAIISFLSVQGRSNPTLLIIATTICFVGIISFIIVIVFWAIDLRNMVWYQAFFLLGFIINIVPHVLLTLNVSELHTKLDNARRK